MDKEDDTSTISSNELFVRAMTFQNEWTTSTTGTLNFVLDTDAQRNSVPKY